MSHILHSSWSHTFGHHRSNIHRLPTVYDEYIIMQVLVCILPEKMYVRHLVSRIVTLAETLLMIAVAFWWLRPYSTCPFICNIYTLPWRRRNLDLW